MRLAVLVDPGFLRSGVLAVPSIGGPLVVARPGLGDRVQFQAAAAEPRGTPMARIGPPEQRGVCDDVARCAQYGWQGKRRVGKATGDKDTENEGEVDQAKSSLKDAGEKVKDAFKK